MKQVYNSLTELIGRTPLLRLNRYCQFKEIPNNIIAKIEFFNPGGSVKDRIALSMILDAEEKGLIKDGATIIEPTSGNTGIGIALVAATKGYKTIFTMPENMSVERQKILKFLGAKIVLTPKTEGMNGAVQKANEIKEQTPNSIVLKQFENPANISAHIKNTTKEIWEATNGCIDIFVAGVGTGGTLSGTTIGLKKLKPTLQSVAVEPFSSPLLSEGKAGPHAIQGIGANFIPTNFKKEYVDQIIKIKDEEALETSRLLGKTEGLIVGISAGAAVCAATKIAQLEENKDKEIVVILPDTGERYLSTPLFDL